MMIRDRSLGLWQRGALSGLLVLGIACAAEPLPPPAPPEVGVSQPITRPVTLFAEFTGTTRGSESVEIRARVTGTLEQVAFEVGRPVNKGDLLFVIEPRPYRAALNSAEAGLRAAQAELARTESDLRRVTQAAQTNAVSESDVDLAQANRDMAQANVYTAEADLDQAQLQYSYTSVQSPIDGIVDRNLFDVGNVVGGPGEDVLTSVNRVAPLFVYFDVPERAILEILKYLDYTRSEEGVYVGTDSASGSSDNRQALDDDTRTRILVGTLVDDGFPHEGVIDFLSNTVDASTGTIEVRGRLPNERGLLFPGLFVRVRIPLGHDRRRHPDRRDGPGHRSGWALCLRRRRRQHGRAALRRARTDRGRRHGTGLEGLELSETYIVEGVLRARPGMPVIQLRAVGCEIAHGRIQQVLHLPAHLRDGDRDRHRAVWARSRSRSCRSRAVPTSRRRRWR